MDLRASFKASKVILDCISLWLVQKPRHPLNQSHAKEKRFAYQRFSALKAPCLFSLLVEVILDCFGFTSPRPLIGPETSRHPLNQKRICSPALSCALSTALVFLFESSLANDDVTFALIGRSDYFCFGLRRSFENNSNVVTPNFIKEVRKVNISGNLTICVMQKA